MRLGKKWKKPAKSRKATVKTSITETKKLPTTRQKTLLQYRRAKTEASNKMKTLKLSLSITLLTGMTACESFKSFTEGYDRSVSIEYTDPSTGASVEYKIQKRFGK
jgi:hypothetical protein